MKSLMVTAGLVILIPSMASALPMDCAKYKGYKPSYCDPTAPPKKTKIKEHYERLPPRPGYPLGAHSPPAPPGYYDRDDDGDDFLDKINPLEWFGNNSGGGLPGEETTQQVLSDPLGVTDKILSDPIGSSKMFNPLDD